MTETLAQKIDWLVQHVPDIETGISYPLVELTARIREYWPDTHATRKSEAAVCDTTNVANSQELIAGLAQIFGVSPAFFSPAVSIRDLQEQLECLAILREILRGHNVSASLRVGCIR